MHSYTIHTYMPRSNMPIHTYTHMHARVHMCTHVDRHTVLMTCWEHHVPLSALPMIAVTYVCSDGGGLTSSPGCPAVSGEVGVLHPGHLTVGSPNTCSTPPESSAVHLPRDTQPRLMVTQQNTPMLTEGRMEKRTAISIQSKTWCQR